MTPEIDFASSTWKALVERMTDRVETFRAKNDGALSVEQTAHLRGRIAELKHLLALGNPSPGANATDEPYRPSVDY